MTKRDEICLCDGLVQKIIKKYCPGCEQKQVWEDMPDSCSNYDLWQKMTYSNRTCRIALGSKDVTKLIFEFARRFRTKIKNKRAKLILWRSVPYIWHDNGIFYITARFGYKK